MSAVLSVIDTSITISIEMIAATWNCGAPKWNGEGNANTGTCASWPKSVLPSGIAARVPTSSPSRIEMLRRKPARKRLSSSTTARVSPARPMSATEPKSWALGSPPSAQLAATGNSERPIRVITVPLTTGGKKRFSRPKYGAAKNAATPATRMPP